MTFTVNKSTNPYNGLNIHLRSLSKTGLTKHKIGFSYNDQDLQYADMIILGNYLPEEIYSISTNLMGKTKIGYMFCSPLGQASCNGELGILRDLYKMLDDRNFKLDYLFCTDMNMVKVLNHKQVRPLPPVSDFEGMFAPWSQRKDLLLIGNNLRIHRNFANQLAGIKLAQEEEEFGIVSYGMPHDAYQFFQDLFRITNWVNNEKFLTEEEKVRVVAKSRLGLQVTYSDSFNIAAYESAMCHVPCLISESLPWGPRELKVKDVDDPVAIGLKIKTFLKDSPGSQMRIGEQFNQEAKNAMKKNFSICEKTLKDCL